MGFRRKHEARLSPAGQHKQSSSEVLLVMGSAQAMQEERAVFVGMNLNDLVWGLLTSRSKQAG